MHKVIEPILIILTLQLRDLGVQCKFQCFINRIYLCCSNTCV